MPARSRSRLPSRDFGYKRCRARSANAPPATPRSLPCSDTASGTRGAWSGRGSGRTARLLGPMKIETASPAAPTSPPPPPGAPVRAWMGSALLLTVVGGILLVFFLSIFPIKGYSAPIGWDASEYLWRTRLAQAEGLDATTVAMPTATRPKSGRPGYVV